jgi:hypothetical protein
MISSMAERTAAKAAAGALRTVKRQRISINHHIAPASMTSALSSQRHFSIGPNNNAPNQPSILGLGFNPASSSTAPTSYFQRPSLPANTVIRFVPQQTAWIVERMGKFNRILQPGLAILIPFIDRIAYVKSLKEAAIEIPSQSAITADNVTLELDGVLYTRVFDAYKARYFLLQSVEIWKSRVGTRC